MSLNATAVILDGWRVTPLVFAAQCLAVDRFELLLSKNTDAQVTLESVKDGKTYRCALLDVLKGDASNEVHPEFAREKTRECIKILENHINRRKQEALKSVARDGFFGSPLTKTDGASSPDHIQFAGAPKFD